MYNPEITLILLNLIIVISAYTIVFPNIAGNNINRLLIFDLMAMIFAVGMAKILFGASGHDFYALFMTTNWFWFSLLSYIMIEVPFCIWYIVKFNLWQM